VKATFAITLLIGSGVGIVVAAPAEQSMPPARAEAIPPSPGPGYNWVPGHWAWRGVSWQWIPSHHVAKAEAYFERALAVAREQQAKSWELRAAMIVFQCPCET
jgi:hypothetical protein